VLFRSQGSRSEHLCAFARIFQDRAVVAVVPRLITRLTPEGAGLPLGAAWGDTTVTVPSWKAESPYRNLFTGEALASAGQDEAQVLPAAAILGHCPVALLERVT